MQWPVPLPEGFGTASATFSKLEMQHSPKIFCNFLEKSLAKNNAILRELKDYDRTLEIQQRAALVAVRKEEYRRNSAHINRLRKGRNIEAAAGAAKMQMAGAGRDFDKAWLQMKKALERECREWKEEDTEMRGKGEWQVE